MNEVNDFGLDGRVVRASSSAAIELGLIPSLVKPVTLKVVFSASLLDAIALNRGECGEQSGKFTCCAVREDT